MAALYELTGEWIALMEMMEDEECAESVIIDTLESINYEIEDKADNYAKIIKTFKNDIKGIDDEIKRLSDRKLGFEKRIEWLMKNLEECMRVTGKTKFKTNLFSFNIQKNGGKRKLVVDVSVDDLPEEYKVKQPDKPNNDQIREYLKEKGVENENGSITCEFAHLEPQGENLRIR